MRVLLRRLHREGWRFERRIFDIDAEGVGIATYAAIGPARTYTLVCFAHDLPAEKRSDRVIADAWDATFALFDGIPSAVDIARLGDNVPRQEGGRYRDSDLVLARANRSVRLFDDVVAALAVGRQPERTAIESVGYLMRTTAVYGNGKFGIADRDRVMDRAELAGPFQAEMLTVWLIRAFTTDLVEHLARLRGGAAATILDRDLRRRLGVGNATGLGMAPFLVKHPALINNWIAARETALCRVRAVPSATKAEIDCLRSTIDRGRRGIRNWCTPDPVQGPRIAVLASELDQIAARATPIELAKPFAWDALYRWAETNLSLEGQEFSVSFLMEPHGPLVDTLFDTMVADEQASFAIDGRMTCDTLLALIDRNYAWALAVDFSRSTATQRFWYVSEEKLEPRLGDRTGEPGADLEQPLAVARDVSDLRRELVGRQSQASNQAQASVAEFLLRLPQHRHTVRRVQLSRTHPYSELHGNLVAADFRAIDVLRCKLSFFGATRFDPRSDKWLRITMYQSAPFPDELADAYRDDWIWGEPC